MPLISSVKSEIKRIQQLPRIQAVVRANKKKLSEAALERMTYWTKKIITYVHNEHPVHNEIPADIAALGPSEKLATAFRKIHTLSDADLKLAWGMFFTIAGSLLVDHAPKRADSNILTVSNVNEAALFYLQSMPETLIAMMKQRSPSEKRRKSKKSRSRKSMKSLKKYFKL
jgi:hypothetical protein